ncbi:MAG: hypothetical protein HOJ13_02855 [Nitrospina sp.]|jgi:hypothetical protein|nr:hypothetical protein [Nitrospina sp.]
MNEKLVLTDEEFENFKRDWDNGRYGASSQDVSHLVATVESLKTSNDALVALVKLANKAKAETAKLVEECDEDMISAQKRENKLKEEVESLRWKFMAQSVVLAGLKEDNA